MLSKKQFNLAFIVILILAALIRFIGLNKFPPAPYWEEIALGYDAYSLLKTGQDHHGNPWPVVAFESFGDYKPSGYFYALMPFIAVFGLNVKAIRLPSALAGVFLVAGIIVISRLLFFPDKNSKKSIWPLIAGLVMSISPWAILFSRAAWEVNLASTFLLWGIIFGLKTLQSKNFKYYWFHLLFLILTLYTYHSTRITAPLIGLWFLIHLFKQKIISKKQNLAQLAVALLISFLLALPMLLAMNKPEFRIRFAQTSAFNNLELIEASNWAKERLNNSLYARIVYHRYWFFLKEVALNFLDHFNLDFLFISGDSNARHSIQMMGQLYHLELVFLFLGLIYLLKTKRFNQSLLAFWLLAAILPASLTKTTPHALRILPSLSIFILVITLGLFNSFKLVKQLISNLLANKILNKKIINWGVALCLVVAYSLEFTYFVHSYTKLYPLQYANEWQYGYQKMITAVKMLQQESPELPVYITREQGRPAMYYWFYTQTDPRLVQAENVTATKDQGEFLEFANLKFVNGLNLANNEAAIIVGSPVQIEIYKATCPQNKVEIKQEIFDLNKKFIWQLASVEI